MKGKTAGTWLFLALLILLTGIVAVGAVGAEDKVTQSGPVTIYKTPEQSKTGAGIDFENAVPMPLPQATQKPSGPVPVAPPARLPGSPGYSPGSRGSDKAAPPATDAEGPAAAQDNSIASPQEYGTLNVPYTTSRVDVGVNNAISRIYPYRASGKLFFNIGADTFVCSASLIKRGVLVTAAHCVANFGQNQYYTNWVYVPAAFNNARPYGLWRVDAATVLTSYLNGTDPCSSPGVVCQNDIAVLVVRPRGGGYPGRTTGWLGYGWDGYGFTTALNPNVALIHQLGYPTSHDFGLKMQRTDSQAYIDAMMSNNLVWGSRQTSGASGGPELVNLGTQAVLSENIVTGFDAAFNTVVGVTSWQYADPSLKGNGASPFLSTNIVELVNAACAAFPRACLD
jgi:V8-like Glu-specific endopeptidase